MGTLEHHLDPTLVAQVLAAGIEPHRQSNRKILAELVRENREPSDCSPVVRVRQARVAPQAYLDRRRAKMQRRIDKGSPRPMKGYS